MRIETSNSRMRYFAVMHPAGELIRVVPMLFLFGIGMMTGWLRTVSAASADLPAVPFRFVRLRTDEGLSHNDVRAIAQDHAGFMWFGTSLGGLNRFDGYECRVYRHDTDDPRSLGNSTVWSLLVDRAGTLWVGTANGLDRYDPATDSFYHFRHNPADATSLIGYEVLCLYEDRAGRLWAGTESGLSCLDPERGTFVNYPRDPKADEGVRGSLQQIVEDRETGHLWLAMGNGVQVLDPKSGRTLAYYTRGLSANRLRHHWARTLLQDRAGIFWIGTRRGLHRFVPETRTFVTYLHDPDDPASLGHDAITAVYEDRQGRFWVLTEGGLDQFDRTSGRFTHYRSTRGDSDSLSADWCSRILEDHEGALWVGTYTGGVNRFAGSTKAFVSCRRRIGDIVVPNPDPVTAMAVDSNGLLWVGRADGLSTYDGACWFHYRHDPTVPGSISEDVISAITMDRSGVLWVGTKNQGLNRWDGQRFRHYRRERPLRADERPAPDTLASNEVYALLPDIEQGLWIGMRGWLDHFNGTTFTHLRSADQWPDVPSLSPVFGSQEPNRILWFGGQGAGLIRMEPDTARCSNFLVDPVHAEAATLNKVFAVYADGQGTVWVGGRSGLHRFDTAARQFIRTYTIADGLPNDTVGSILDDGRGYLWLGTLAGLVRFDPQRETFRNYDMSDGLPSNRISDQSAAQGPDGRLFFGTANGVFAFYPERITENPHPPPVVLTDFELFNRPVRPGAEGAPLTETIGRVERITLRHNQSVFTLKFAALGYTAPEKNRYAYKMEGFDEDWRYTDAARRYATYTRLAPGRYIFRVRASNNDGVWNAEGTSLAVTILPPWWGTWWFRVLLLVSMAAAVLVAHKSRTRYMTKRNLQLAAQVRERTAQLEEANKELEAFSYSVSHDLRAPLRSIDGFSNLLLKRYLNELDAKGEDYLYRISNATQRMGRLIDDLLNLSRISRTEMTFKPVNLSETVHLLADELRKAEPERDVAWEIGDDITAHGDPALLRIMLENLVGNAWKFTMKNKQAHIEFGVEKQGDQEVYYIRDNGAGFDMKYADKLFGAFQRLHTTSEYPGTGIGLVICKRIVSRHGGRIWAYATVGQGATLYFTLP